MGGAAALEMPFLPPKQQLAGLELAQVHEAVVSAPLQTFGFICRASGSQAQGATGLATDLAHFDARVRRTLL